MSAGTAGGAVRLTPQEALARDLIGQRVAARRHVPTQQSRSRRHVRAAVLLRRLADRLDPTVRSAKPALPDGVTGTARGEATVHVLPAPHSGRARPWSAAPRRAPHRHT